MWPPASDAPGDLDVRLVRRDREAAVEQLGGDDGGDAMNKRAEFVAEASG
jgi:hypothetical protein